MEPCEATAGIQPPSAPCLHRHTSVSQRRSPATAKHPARCSGKHGQPAPPSRNQGLPRERRGQVLRAVAEFLAESFRHRRRLCATCPSGGWCPPTLCPSVLDCCKGAQDPVCPQSSSTSGQWNPTGSVGGRLLSPPECTAQGRPRVPASSLWGRGLSALVQHPCQGHRGSSVATSRRAPGSRRNVG